MKLAALGLLAAFASTAAFAQDIPEALRGTYAAPSCAEATTAVHITARSVVEMALEGEQRLIRARTLRQVQDWTLFTRDDPAASRILLRRTETGIEGASPEPKTRDDRLPGNIKPVSYDRCAEAPTLVALHAEGFAFLHALEAMEPVCGAGNDVQACLRAFFAYADVSRDEALSPAEIARALRGATWAVQMSEGADGATLAAGYAGSALLGIAVAQVVVQAYDYDLSGTLSLAELTQDRSPVALTPPARTASVPPLPLDALAGQLGGLKEALERLPDLLR